MTDRPDIYGLIGYPLGHSRSEAYFNDKFSREHINARYLNFELPDIGDLMELIAEYPSLRGFNVTIPYKELIIPYLDSIEPRAARIGAVNVVRVDNAGGQITLHGYNSDVTGFGDSIRPLLRPDHRAALVLGTGGASRAVAYALSDAGLDVVKVSRAPAHGLLGYGDLTPEVIGTHKVIVNTTPLGMFPDTDSYPDIPYECLTPQHLCYDVVYNPETTMFMKLSAAQGAATVNGLEMLHLQAVGAWKIWSAR